MRWLRARGKPFTSFLRMKSIKTSLLSAALLSLLLATAGCGGDDDGGEANRTSQASDGTAGSQTDRTDGSAGQPQTDDPAGSASGESATGGSERSDSDGSGSGGGSAETGQAKAVSASVYTFLAGMSEQDGRKVCSTYTRETRRLVASALTTDCATAMKYSFKIIVPKGSENAFKGVRVTSVDASGKKATAHLRIPRALLNAPTLQFIARKGKIGLKKESGQWRVELLSLL